MQKGICRLIITLVMPVECATWTARQQKPAKMKKNTYNNISDSSIYSTHKTTETKYNGIPTSSQLVALSVDPILVDTEDVLEIRVSATGLVSASVLIVIRKVVAAVGIVVVAVLKCVVPSDGNAVDV